MRPEDSKSHKLVEALREAEDELFGVAQGFLPGNKVERRIAEDLRSEVYTLLKKMQHYYYPDEEPTWDYDSDNTYCEVSYRDPDWHYCHHSDGTAIFKFKLEYHAHGEMKIADTVQLLPAPNMGFRNMEALVIAHMDSVVSNPNPDEEE